MKVLFYLVVIMTSLAACDHPTKIVQGGISNLPQLPPEEICLNTLKLLRFDSEDLGLKPDIFGATSHIISWKDSAFLTNQTVSDEVYFGIFHNTSDEASCVWQGSLDSFKLYFGNHHQTILIPEGAIYLEQNQKPEIEVFGNDSTRIQGFKITFTGFSGATGNMVYDYYLFDAKANHYVRNNTLSKLTSAHIDLKRGIVTSGWNGGASGKIGGRSMYKLTRTGQLEFLKTWHSALEGNNYRVTYTEMKNSKRVTWSQVVTLDEWQGAVWY